MPFDADAFDISMPMLSSSRFDAFLLHYAFVTLSFSAFAELRFSSIFLFSIDIDAFFFFSIIIAPFSLAFFRFFFFRYYYADIAFSSPFDAANDYFLSTIDIFFLRLFSSFAYFIATLLFFFIAFSSSLFSSSFHFHIFEAFFIICFFALSLSIIFSPCFIIVFLSFSSAAIFLSMMPLR